MKHLFRPLLLAATILVSTGAAFAAVRASSYAASRAILDTGTGIVTATSVSGLGFGKSTAGSKKGGTASAPTLVDVTFAATPQTHGMARAMGYVAGTETTLSASLKLLDVNNSIKQVITLGTASITELQLPGGNARDNKKAAQFRMRLQPAQIDVQAGSGVQGAEATAPTKAPLLSNFRVSIPGVASQNVLAVSPCVVRRSGTEVQISDLSVTLSFAHATTSDWWSWARAKSQKDLKIEYLDPTMASVVFSVDFTGVVVDGFEVTPITSDSEQTIEATYRLSARGVQIH